MTRDYRSRIATADEALAVVQSGQRVYIHNGCAEPVELVQALTRRGPELRDVEVIHLATMGIADYSLPEHEGHFRANALFIGGKDLTVGKDDAEQGPHLKLTYTTPVRTIRLKAATSGDPGKWAPVPMIATGVCMCG